MAKNWIKCPEEWLDTYSDRPDYIVFLLRCVQKASWTDKKVYGIDLKRGEFITSRANFSAITGLTEDKYRTRLKNLIEDGVLETKNIPKQKTIISICNFDDYFGENLENSQQIPNESPTNPQQIPNESPTNPLPIPYNIDIDIDIYNNKKKKNGEIFNQRKAELTAAGVRMTDEGIEEFIELNEQHPQFAPFGLGYRRGVAKSAILFLQRRENAQYRIREERNNSSKPPSSAAPPRWQSEPHIVFAEKIQHIIRNHPENPDLGMWLAKIKCLSADANGMNIQASAKDIKDMTERKITNFINQEFRGIKLNIQYT